MSYLQANTLGITGYKSQFDSTAHIVPAGSTPLGHEQTTKDALDWTSNERPATPEEQKRWRKSTVNEPGIITRHPGHAKDPIPQGPFGVQSKQGESAAATMKQLPESQVQQWRDARKEEIYASSTREPLGSGYVRGHNLPAGAGTTEAFGVKYNAKHLQTVGQIRDLMTSGKQVDDKATHTMYVKSHGSYSPGEQRQRGYDWALTKVGDLNFHSFGAVDKEGIRDGVKKALQPALGPAVPETKVVSKIYEDFKANGDYLGKGRKIGAVPVLPAGHAFGLTSVKKGCAPEPGVDELIQGSYSVEAQQPDADLGKSLREGWRNEAPEGKVFGTPSIRTDIPAPKIRSIASTKNYGNDPNIAILLKPPRSVERGVNTEDYLHLYGRDELKVLVEEAGLSIGEEEFSSIFSMASEADGVDGKACIDTLFRARKAHLEANHTPTIRL